MRILFVTQVALDRPYGGPRHVLAVARALAERGHELVLLAPGREPEALGARRLRPPSRLGPGLRLEAAQASLALSAHLMKRFDVAYVRLSATTSVVPAVLRAARLPYVTELNGLLLDELQNRGRSRLARLAVGAAQRAVARGAFACVSVEPRIGRHAKEALGARDVRIIENGADLETARPGDRRQARVRTGLPLDAPVVAFAGTLGPELRLDLLFAAIARMSEEPLLVVAGDGQERAAVEAAARAAPNVRFFGPLPHEEAVDLLRAADVCVDVRNNHLGMKVIEYAALGRRFAAFSVEGLPRIEAAYAGHRAVFAVEARTSEALAAALSEALHAERAGPLPAEAVDAARSELGWARTAARIERVLEEAVSARR